MVAVAADAGDDVVGRRFAIAALLAGNVALVMAPPLIGLLVLLGALS